MQQWRCRHAGSRRGGGRTPKAIHEFPAHGRDRDGVIQLPHTEWVQVKETDTVIIAQGARAVFSAGG